MDRETKAAMIDEAIIKCDRRHGRRPQTLPVIEDDVLTAGVNASKGEIGRRAALLALCDPPKIARPLATLGEMCTGLWRKRDA